MGKVKNGASLFQRFIGSPGRALKKTYRQDLEMLNAARKSSNADLEKARRLGGGYARDYAMRTSRKNAKNLASQAHQSRDAWRAAQKDTRRVRMGAGALTLGLTGAGYAGKNKLQAMKPQGPPAPPNPTV